MVIVNLANVGLFCFSRRIDDATRMPVNQQPKNTVGMLPLAPYSQLHIGNHGHQAGAGCLNGNQVTACYRLFY
jgi:hypothetical protein